jgi:HK97 family phage major capsid protein
MHKLAILLVSLLAGTVCAAGTALGAYSLDGALLTHVTDYLIALGTQTDPGLMLAAAIPASTQNKIESIKNNIQKIMDPDDGLMVKIKSLNRSVSHLKEEVAKRSVDNAEWVDEVGDEVYEAKVKSKLDTLQDELHDRLDDLEQYGSLTNGKAMSARENVLKSFRDAYEEVEDPKGSSWKAKIQGSMLKDITNLSGSAGPAIVEQQRDEIIDIALREVTIFDLLDSIPVSTDTVDYVEEEAVTDNTGAQPGQGSTVSFSDWEFNEVSKKIETIMNKVRAAEQVLDDEPRLENFVQQKLRRRLLLEAERQVVVGDGVGNNLLGLVPQSTSYDSNLESNVTGSAVTDIDRIMVAILQTQRSELPATGIIMPNLNWTAIQLLKDDQGRYIFVQPQSDTTPRLWGLPVNATNVLPEGSAHVGNYQLGATFYDRQDVEVRVSTEDSDNFQKLMVTFRTTMRGQVAVERKKALISLPSGTLDATAPSTGS